MKVLLGNQHHLGNLEESQFTHMVVSGRGTLSFIITLFVKFIRDSVAGRCSVGRLNPLSKRCDNYKNCL